MQQKYIWMVVLFLVLVLILIQRRQQTGGSFAFIEELPCPKATASPAVVLLKKNAEAKKHTYYGHGIPLRPLEKGDGEFYSDPLPIVHNMPVDLTLNTHGLPFSTDRGAIAANSHAIEDYFFPLPQQS